jgi:hypothetical protein
MGEQQAVAFEFTRVIVLRAGRRALDEVTASIPAAGITGVMGGDAIGNLPGNPTCPNACIDWVRREIHSAPVRERDEFTDRRAGVFGRRDDDAGAACARRWT